MFEKKFHKDVFIPEGADEACEALQKCLGKYFLSRHLQEHIDNQAGEDRSHRYLGEALKECLNTLKDSPREVFEVVLGKDYHKFGKGGWFVTKYCCRIPYNDDQDIVVAIRPQYKGDAVVDNMVVTAWMNGRDDHHSTLRSEEYCSEEEWLRCR